MRTRRRVPGRRRRQRGSAGLTRSHSGTFFCFGRILRQSPDHILSVPDRSPLRPSLFFNRLSRLDPPRPKSGIKGATATGGTRFRLMVSRRMKKDKIRQQCALQGERKGPEGRACCLSGNLSPPCRRRCGGREPFGVPAWRPRVHLFQLQLAGLFIKHLYHSF